MPVCVCEREIGERTHSQTVCAEASGGRLMPYLVSPPYSFETEPLTERRVRLAGRSPSDPSVSPPVPTITLGLQVPVATPGGFLSGYKIQTQILVLAHQELLSIEPYPRPTTIILWML